MRIPFVKMHGLGNDFIVLDGRAELLPAITTRFAAALADRHTGIGCDQLIVLGLSDVADVRMQIFNSDGGEVEACGNANRAVGLLLGTSARIETLGGLLRVNPTAAGVSVDMGAPKFEWNQIPLAYPLDTHSMPVAWDELVSPCAVNVGNPHVIFFVADSDMVSLDQLGPEIEHDALFPDRINVNIATIETPRRIRLRVWERGVGETRACGTGACATAIAAMRRGLVERSVTVALAGGELAIEWLESGTIRMTGAAAESFRGSLDPADYGAAT